VEHLAPRKKTNLLEGLDSTELIHEKKHNNTGRNSKESPKSHNNPHGTPSIKHIQVNPTKPQGMDSEVAIIMVTDWETLSTLENNHNRQMHAQDVVNRKSTGIT
jgi:hypothetical protein